MRSTPIERNSGVRIYQPFLGTFLVLFSIFFPTYSAASETKTTSDWLNHIVKLTNQKSCYFEILKIWRKRPRFFLKMVCGYRPMQARTGYTGHRNCFFLHVCFLLVKYKSPNARIALFQDIFAKMNPFSIKSAIITALICTLVLSAMTSETEAKCFKHRSENRCIDAGGRRPSSGGVGRCEKSGRECVMINHPKAHCRCVYNKLKVA